MKFTRMLSALFIAASLVLGMNSTASADQLQDIKARGTLRVAIPQDYPPFGFMGPDKKLKGYDIEMAGIVAKSLGVKCELVPVTGANRIPFLLSNRADIVISTLGKTKERQKVIDFSIACGHVFRRFRPGKNKRHEARRSQGTHHQRDQGLH